MKAVALTAFAALIAFCPAVDAQDLLAQAQTAFSRREFDSSGIAQASIAADLYGQLAAKASGATEKAQHLISRAEALYFVGNASEPVQTKLESHWQGHEAANQALEVLGLANIRSMTAANVSRVKASRSATDLALIAEGLYQRGINLGQWGAANGIVESLSHWPELRRNMEIIVEIGQEPVREYGAYRTLGRGFFKIPTLLGGNLQKAQNYLRKAVNGTRAQGRPYSTNGYNNVYYAEVLYRRGGKAAAISLLEGFVGAPLTSLNPSLEPENREAKRLAEELLTTWKKIEP